MGRKRLDLSPDSRLEHDRRLNRKHQKTFRDKNKTQRQITERYSIYSQTVRDFGSFLNNNGNFLNNNGSFLNNNGNNIRSLGSGYMNPETFAQQEERIADVQAVDENRFPESVTETRTVEDNRTDRDGRNNDSERDTSLVDLQPSEEALAIEDTRVLEQVDKSKNDLVSPSERRTKRRKKSKGYVESGGYDWDKVLGMYLISEDVTWDVVCGLRECATECLYDIRRNPDLNTTRNGKAAQAFLFTVKKFVNEEFHGKRLQTLSEREDVEVVLHFVADEMFGKDDERLPLDALEYVKNLVSDSLHASTGEGRKRKFLQKDDAYGILLNQYDSLEEEADNLREENGRLKEEIEEKDDLNIRLREEIDRLQNRCNKLEGNTTEATCKPTSKLGKVRKTFTNKKKAFADKMARIKRKKDLED